MKIDGKEFKLDGILSKSVTEEQITNGDEKLKNIFAYFDTDGEKGVFSSAEMNKAVSIFKGLDEQGTGNQNGEIEDGEIQNYIKNDSNSLFERLNIDANDMKTFIKNVFRAFDENAVQQSGDNKNLPEGTYQYTVQHKEDYTDLIRRVLIKQHEGEDNYTPTDSEIEEAKKVFKQDNPGAVHGKAPKEWLMVGAKVRLRADLGDLDNASEQVQLYEDNVNAKRAQRNQHRADKSRQKERAEAAKKEQQLQKAKQLRTQVNNIVNKLGATPSPKNKALDSITPENVVFVLSVYNQSTSRKLALDLINNGDKNLATVKNKICKNLVTRAQQLGLKIYYSSYFNINSTTELIAWIDKTSAKIRELECKNNPQLAGVFSNKTKESTQKDVNLLIKDGNKIASELYNEIKGISFNKSEIKKLLSKFNTQNAAFIITEYKNLVGNKNKKSLVKAIDDEVGLGIEDVKKYICPKLVEQAKNYGLNGIYHSTYQKINDIDTLDKWINKISEKIRAVATQTTKISKNEKNHIGYTTRKEGDFKIKTITQHPCFKEAGIKKIEEKYSLKGKLIEKKTYFNDGQITLEHYVQAQKGQLGYYRKEADGSFTLVDEDGQANQGLYIKKKEIIQQGTKNRSITKVNTSITEAITIDNIEMPANATAAQKQFAQALIENKAKLMKALNMDNDSYNMLIKVALGIAEQETKFGAMGLSLRGGKYEAFGRLDSISGGTGSVASRLVCGKGLSAGMTQIKYYDQIKDSMVKEQFDAFGITCAEDLYDPAKCAIATMILLSINLTRFRNNKNMQQGAKAANGLVTQCDGWEKKDGTLQKTYDTQPFVNEVTEEDAMCYMWNGKNRTLINGNAEPLVNDYSRNVRQYMKQYKIQENQKSRQDAILKSNTKKVNRNFKSMDNNGAMGSIVFMPKMYKTDLVNKESEIAILEKALSNNKIEEKSKNELIKAVKNGEIAFEYGLTEAEANSLTQKDVDLLLQHIGKLKKTLEAKTSSLRFNDGISSNEGLTMRNTYQDLIREAESKFTQEYLNSKSPVVSTEHVNQSNVLMTPNNNKLNASQMHRKDGERRGFIGFRNRDFGVNTQNTNDVNVALAKAAEKESVTRGSCGNCLGGVRAAFDAMGIDTRTDGMEYTPKRMANYFENHPEMFEEVKYINIGGGKSRQINSSDLPTLPAGYIVVFIPDNNFSSEKGHIAITNGYGQGYADEADNLNWGDYSESNTENNKSGKGEHGTFRVFRLTDKWKLDPSTGKLKFNG